MPASEETAPPIIINAAPGLRIDPRWPRWLGRRRFSHSGHFTISPVLPPTTPGLLIYVHGYNETPATAQGYGRNNIAAGYREAGGKCPVATFLWNSRFGTLRFRDSIRSANATAPIFADAVTALRTASPGLRLHVLAHSLGARVVLKAVQERNLSLQDVALVSAAIGRRSLEPGAEFGEVPGRVDRLLITHNRADRCLGWYRFFWGRALGQAGFRASAHLPASVFTENLESVWKAHPNDGGHGAILHPEYWKAFWERAAARGFFQ